MATATFIRIKGGIVTPRVQLELGLLVLQLFFYRSKNIVTFEALPMVVSYHALDTICYSR